MSKKSDLLVRVRYLNPVPDPPFPPKLLNIQTDINRLGEPSYLNHLAASTPLPMLVDSEMGMPLDLNAYEGVWDGQDQVINPSLDAGRVHHPIDVYLLAPFQPPATTNGEQKAPVTTEVSWMRNSSYLTRKNTAKRREAADARMEAAVDASEAAQIMAIDKTFLDLQSQDSRNIKHPDVKKKGLKVVESYDILPDDDAWSNSYILMRFPERPSAATSKNPAAPASSGRLAKSLLRPVVEEDQQIMEFHLPREEDLSKMDKIYETPLGPDQLKALMEASETNDNDPLIEEIFPHAIYERIRTYEVVSQTMLEKPGKEVLVSFQEDEPASKKRKGVFYKDIRMRTVLRKTRAMRRDDDQNRTASWDKTRLGYRLPNEHENETRRSARDQVVDPLWTNAELRRLHGGDNLAEGQGEAIDDEEVGVVDGAERAESEVDED